MDNTPQSRRASTPVRYWIASLLLVLTPAIALQSQSVAAQAGAPDPDRYIVQFKEPGNSAGARAAIAAAGGAVLLEMPGAGAAAARIPQQALAGLQKTRISH